jgi:hypothetical protein
MQHLGGSDPHKSQDVIGYRANILVSESILYAEIMKYRLNLRMAMRKMASCIGMINNMTLIYGIR